MLAPAALVTVAILPLVLGGCASSAGAPSDDVSPSVAFSDDPAVFDDLLQTVWDNQSADQQFYSCGQFFIDPQPMLDYVIAETNVAISRAAFAAFYNHKCREN
jgi:hypothetical protein